MSTIYHEHHIIPRHAGGTDEPSNLIQLTVEEHAEAHKKLWEQYGCWQDYVAWQALAGYITNADAHILAVKKANTGRKLTQEHKNNIGKANLGRKKSQKVKDKIGSKNKGRKPSTLAIKNSINTRKKGVVWSEERKMKHKEQMKLMNQSRRSPEKRDEQRQRMLGNKRGIKSFP